MSRRILLLITDLQIGGTPTVVRELAVRLREPGRVDIEVACLAPWGPVADQLRDAGVRVHALGAESTAAFPATLATLVRLVRRGGFDTVFSFLVHANAVAAAASAFCSDVRFLQSVQTTQPNPRWHWRLQRLIHPAADAVVVPSPSAARAANEWAGVPLEKIVVIPNAVDVASFDAVYAANSVRPAAQPTRVGFIGRLDPIKRVPALVVAMTHLPNARLDVFGDGPDRPRIESAVARHGLADRVTLHGTVARPHESLAGMDVLVLASAAEGFGLVLIEAMAAGVPVVGNDVPGIRDVVVSGTSGLLCDGRPAALATAVDTLRSPAARRAVIPAARAHVERRYGWPAVLTAYRSLLRTDDT